MPTLETAQEIYEEETKGEKSVNALAGSLERRADELAQREVADEHSEMRNEVRSSVSDTLNAPEQRKEEAAKLDQAAEDLRASLGSHNPTMKQLPGNVAGQAQLQSSNMWVDTQAIRSGTEDKLIDTAVASDIGKHEGRHKVQSATADADVISVKGQQLTATELREFDAMEEQASHDFLSAEYKATRAKVGAVLSAADREMIKTGQFRALERRYAEQEQTLAA